MSQRISYSYSILRYVHDIATGEFVNVGLVLFSRDAGFIKFKGKTTTGRISGLFPNLKAVQYKTLIRLVKERFQVIEKECAPGLGLNDRSKSTITLVDLLAQALPKDDSSLVWSQISSGVSERPEVAFEKIYSRYVTKFDSKQPVHGKSDDDVWRSFRRDLEQRNLLQFFESKVISGADDEVEFPLAWKNGIWHCIEPVSFDLSAPESIREKAHKCLGQIASISDAAEKFKLYMVVAKPRDESLLDAFKKAIHLLEKIPGSKEIFTEDQSSVLADQFSSRILAKEGAAGQAGVLDLGNTRH